MKKKTVEHRDESRQLEYLSRRSSTTTSGYAWLLFQIGQTAKETTAAQSQQHTKQNKHTPKPAGKTIHFHQPQKE